MSLPRHHASVRHCLARFGPAAAVAAGTFALLLFSRSSPAPIAGWDLTVGRQSGHLRSAPSTRELERLAPLLGETFNVAWNGFYVALVPGEHTFVLDADDEAALLVAGEQVVELRGATGLRRTWATRRLSTGVHPVRVEYRQLGGSVGLRLSHRQPHDAYADLDQRVFPTRADARRWLAIRLAGTAAAFLCAVFTGTAIIVGAARLLRRWLAPVSCPGPQRAVLLLAFGALASGLSWGLPGFYSWAPDEIRPARVLDGLQMRFSSGWYDLYPPAYFYLLSLLYAPFVWLSQGGAFDPGDLYQRSILVVVTRLLTTALALVSCWLVFTIARALDRPVPAAVAGAALTAFSPLFLYYGRTANVDMTYVTCVLATIAAYVRLLGRPDWTLGYVVLAACAALAVAAKDQSYAFLPGIAAHLVVRRYRSTGSVVRLVGDPKLWLSLAVFLTSTALLFNLAGNWEGVFVHVRLITGPASDGYRLHPMTLAGLWALAVDVLAQWRWSLGWAATLAVPAGVLVARRGPWPTLPLVVPSLSYLVTFIAVVGYSYDRFLLVPVAMACVAAGTAVGAWWTRPGRQWGRVLAGLVLAYTAAHGLTVTALTLRDSRYAVERWLRERVAPTRTVGWIGRLEYLPRLRSFGTYEMITRHDLDEPTLEFVVVNRTFSARTCAAREPCRSLYDGTSGFERVLTTGERGWWMRWEWQHPPGVEDPLTNLSKISPVIDVFGRARSEP